jgi:hypothetical protein
MGSSTCLALSQNQVRLFHGSRCHISEVILAMRFPARLPMRSATTSRKNSCSFTPVVAMLARLSIMPQGAGKGDVKLELRKCSSLVDEGLKKYIGHTGAPLVLAGVD